MAKWRERSHLIALVKPQVQAAIGLDNRDPASAMVYKAHLALPAPNLAKQEFFAHHALLRLPMGTFSAAALTHLAKSVAGCSFPSAPT